MQASSPAELVDIGAETVSKDDLEGLETIPKKNKSVLETNSKDVLNEFETDPKDDLNESETDSNDSEDESRAGNRSKKTGGIDIRRFGGMDKLAIEKYKQLPISGLNEAGALLLHDAATLLATFEKMEITTVDGMTLVDAFYQKLRRPWLESRSAAYE